MSRCKLHSMDARERIELEAILDGIEEYKPSKTTLQLLLDGVPNAGGLKQLAFAEVEALWRSSFPTPGPRRPS